MSLLVVAAQMRPRLSDVSVRIDCEEVEVVVETLEQPARRVEFAEAPVGARPHIPLTVNVDGVDAVAYQAAGVVRAHLVLYEAVVALFVFEQPLLRGREQMLPLASTSK